MSIINDALKRAEKDKRLSQDKSIQILSKMEKIKTGAQRYIVKRWLFWISAGVVCLLGVILVTNSFQSTPDKISSESIFTQEALTEVETTPGVFHLKKIDIETPGETSDFNLSGILYDRQRPLAIINERVVEPGALINGAKLLEIHPDYVRLSLQGKEFTLKIK